MPACKWKSIMGQCSPAFLALPHSFYYCMDGRKSFYNMAGSFIWNSIIDGRSSLLYFSPSLIRLHGKNSTIAKAIGKDRKGIISEVFYLAGIVLAFINPWIGLSCYFVVTSIWLIPDRRIEKKLANEEQPR